MGDNDKKPEKKVPVKEVGVGNRKPEPLGEKKPEGLKKEIKLGPVYKKEVKGAVFSNKEGGDDKSFVSALEGKASLEVLSGSVDLGKKKANLTFIEGKVEVTGVHGQIDLIDKIKHLLFGDDPKPAVPAAPTAPMAARVGDLTTHLAPLAPGPGSPNVFIGGMPAWRIGLDLHLCPAPGMPHGAGPASPGAPTVLINGAPAARATDFVIEPTGGPDVIVIGCPTVMIGLATPPPSPTTPASAEGGDPWVIFESVASGDVVKVEAGAKAVIEADLAKRKGKAEVQAGGMAALLKGELPLKVRVRIPFTSHYLGLGVKVEGTLISAGLEAGAGAKVNDGKTLFGATAGAKAGVGLGGVGVKAGLDISRK